MTVQWKTNVYAQERSILTVSNYDQDTAVIQIESIIPAGISAKYAIPNNGRALDIDLTDLIRVAYVIGLNGGSFNVVELNSAGEFLNGETRNFTIMGRINPLDYYNILPPDDMLQTFGLSISAPSVMYKSINRLSPIVFEMAPGIDDQQYITGRVAFPPSGFQPIEFARRIEIPISADSVEFWYLNLNMYYRYPLKDLECGKRYAEVEWVSFTGQTRRHVFEVVKLTEETTNEVSLEMLTNEYDVRKDRRVSFSLRLEGLTAYDYWYYSDLVTSSSVKVSLTGTNYRQVQVTAKKSTTPETSAGKPLTLEIPINYVRYDTL